jgi:hypothetical protein
MEFTYDNTLPLPEEVEKEFSDKAGDGLSVTEWLTEPPPGAALIQYGTIWNPETGRYRFVIYRPEHIGPKHPAELAIPIFDHGAFLDLLCISEEMTLVRITGRAPWLGRENFMLPVVRLHAHPMDWLEAGCKGVCHIEPISRKALKDLSQVGTIECSDIYTALEAWDWGFGGEDEELARFSIDDSPFNIRRYFEDEVLWRTAYLSRAVQS